MLKIITNHNKQDITYSFTIGQMFPDIQGKLLQIELSGKELLRTAQEKEIPIYDLDNFCFVWHGRNASRLLKVLREIYD